MKPHLLRDTARPTRTSRTKAVLLGGGLGVNALAQAALIVWKLFDPEPPISHSDMAVLVTVATGLVASWYNREATAAAQLAAMQAEAAARDTERAVEQRTERRSG